MTAKAHSQLLDKKRKDSQHFVETVATLQARISGLQTTHERQPEASTQEENLKAKIPGVAVSNAASDVFENGQSAGVAISKTTHYGISKASLGVWFWRVVIDDGYAMLIPTLPG